MRGSNDIVEQLHATISGKLLALGAKEALTQDGQVQRNAGRHNSPLSRVQIGLGADKIAGHPSFVTRSMLLSQILPAPTQHQVALGILWAWLSPGQATPGQG